MRLGVGGTSLFEPMNVVVAPDGNIFVLDFGEVQVKEFSPDGRLLRRYGAGRGRGPGELLSITDMAVPGGSSVWALDPSGGRIVVFDRHGRAVRHLPLSIPAMRMEVRPNGSFVLLSLNGYLFVEHDSLGNKLREFGHLVPDQGHQGVALQGEFSATDDGGIVFAPMRAGYLARWDGAGELVFYVETVARQPYPPVERRPDGALTIAAKDKRLVTRDVAVRGDEVLILAPLREGAARRWVVDVYGLSDGVYRHSFRIPESAVTRIATAQDALFVVSDTTVARWRY